MSVHVRQSDVCPIYPIHFLILDGWKLDSGVTGRVVRRHSKWF